MNIIQSKNPFLFHLCSNLKHSGKHSSKHFFNLILFRNFYVFCAVIRGPRRKLSLQDKKDGKSKIIKNLNKYVNRKIRNSFIYSIYTLYSNNVSHVFRWPGICFLLFCAELSNFCQQSSKKTGKVLSGVEGILNLHRKGCS